MHPSTPSFTRRRALLALSAPLIAAPAVVRAETVPVKVGFVPVIGAASLFVLDQAGWAREGGLALTTTKFDSGPAAIQAFASGTFDILAIGVAPVAVARAKGLDASVIAGAGLGGSAFVANAELAARFGAAGRAPAQALAAFRKETGRRARIATLPPGGVPTVVLNHWFFELNKVDRDDVEIVSIGIEAAQQAMLAGAVDGATLLEPSVTIVQARNPKLRMVATALEMFPGIPGVVLAVSRRFLAQQRGAHLADALRVEHRHDAHEHHQQQRPPAGGDS